MKNASKTIVYRIDYPLEKNYLYYFPNFEELREKVDYRTFTSNKPLPDDFVWSRFTKGEGRKLIDVDFPLVWSYEELLLMKETVWPVVGKLMEVCGQCYSMTINNISYRLCFP